jgi:uncharacterized peroxidase-related enzyme
MAYNARGIAPETNPVLAEIEQKTGASNLFRTMAHHPRAMEDFYRLYTTLMDHGVVERRLKEMLYLAVSFVNECDYCTRHHVKSARDAGLTEQQIHEIQTEQGQNFTPKEQSALHYAREITRTSAVDDDTRYRLQEQFSNDQFVEITMVVALANFTNRFSNGIDIPLEDEVLSVRL